MQQKLLRLEAVNLAYSIDDTEDLGTRRGGGLMLLEAIRHIETTFNTSLERISTGASAGLFKVLDDKAGTAAAVLGELAGHHTYQHATFVADVVAQSGGNFAGATEAAISANRWQQMQQLSFSSFGLGRSAMGVCKVDEVRTAHVTMRVGNKPDTPVSKSVYFRRDRGMERKQNFYSRELGGTDPTGGSYVESFDHLATAMPPSIRPATLEGKIAVFYADGNKFGRVAQRCKTPQKLTAWDDHIKRTRRQFLRQLLVRAADSPHWKNGGLVRLETLLWGGDEFMMVVPAWCGLELAELFFDSTQDLRYPVDGGDLLSHCCGLVFCHRQAPISGISALAKALADQGKLMNKTLGRLDNRLHWMVLESFDQAAGNMGEFLKRRFSVRAMVGKVDVPVVAWSDLALGPTSVKFLQQCFPTLKDTLPRSAIVQIARRMAEGSAINAAGEAHPLVRRSYLQVIGAAAEAGQRAAFGDLWTALTKQPLPPEDAEFVPSLDHLPAWATITELWDYCVAAPAATPAAGGAL